MPLKAGDIIPFERTFTVRDVELFTEISADEGTHHVTRIQVEWLNDEQVSIDVVRENDNGGTI